MTFPFGVEALHSEKLVLGSLELRDAPEVCSCLLGEPNGWFAVRFGMGSEKSLLAWVEKSVAKNLDRSRLTYSIRDRTTGCLFGETQYYSLDLSLNKIEIGGTQIGARFRNTFVNSESKYRMIQNALERHNFSSVVFKVDPENVTSIRAVKKLGAEFVRVEINSYRDFQKQMRDNLIYEINQRDWLHLKGKIALVTGGARGVGKEIALGLANAGCNIVLVDVGDAKAISSLKHYDTSSVNLLKQSEREVAAL